MAFNDSLDFALHPGSPRPSCGMLAKWKSPSPGCVSVLLAATVLAVYLPVLTLGFVNFDDPEYVSNNPQVLGGLTLGGLKWAFAQGHAANWHPLTWLSHMADCVIYEAKPAGHHLTNLLFHTSNTVVLFLLLRFLTGALWRSAIVAALFAVHPVHVESVAWVSERKDVLSTFLGLLCLGAYASYVKHSGAWRGSELQNDQKINQRDETVFTTAAAATTPPTVKLNQQALTFYGMTFVLLTLGLMSKPMLVTWPCLMLLLDFWPFHRIEFGCQRGQLAALRRVVIEKIPFFALSAALCVVTLLVQREAGAVASMEPWPLGLRLGNAMAAYVRYIQKLLWPTKLAVIYPLLNDWRTTALVGFGAVLVGITFVAFCQRRTRPYLFVGWAWYIGTLVPVIGLVQVGSQSIADRYTYVPAIGLFLVLAWGVAEIVSDCTTRRAIATLATVGLLTGCAILAQKQLLYWQNPETLFRHAISVTRSNFVAYNQLGLYYAECREQAAAEHCYRAALAINPRFAHTWNNLGCVLTERGDYPQAMACFQEALRLDARLAAGHASLGTLLLKQGKADEAIAHYSEALRLRPDYAEGHYNLANALAGKGKIEEAREHYSKAVELDPSLADAHNNLAFMLAKAGKLTQAASEFRIALRLQPGLWQAHYGLGESLAAQGQQAEAAREFIALGEAYANSGQFQQAVGATARARDLALAAGQAELVKEAAERLAKFSKR